MSSSINPLEFLESRFFCFSFLAEIGVDVEDRLFRLVDETGTAMSFSSFLGVLFGRGCVN